MNAEITERELEVEVRTICLHRCLLTQVTGDGYRSYSIYIFGWSFSFSIARATDHDRT